MKLSSSLIAKFQQLHIEKFGYAISRKDAETDLRELAELIEITGYAPQAEKDNENVKRNEPKFNR